MKSDIKNEVLIGGTEKREIRIVPHDVRWAKIFKKHAEKIRRKLGSKALRIEHIGSTSVPGLGAKPIVDILLVVANSANEKSYLPAMEQAGYVLRVREPDFHEHRMFRTPERDVHIHVYSPNSPEIERYLIFRNRLRQNAADRRRYEKTKRQLATRDWPHMDAYARAKTAVVESIIAAARISAPVVIEANLAQPKHQRDIRLLTAAYARDPMGNGKPLPPKILKQIIPGLRAHPTTLVLLAYVAGKPAGIATCFFGFSTFTARPILNIHDFAVLKKYRRRGIGRALMQAVEQKARERSCSKLTLEVQEHNHRARRLYEATGFAQALYNKEAGGTLFYAKPL